VFCWVRKVERLAALNLHPEGRRWRGFIVDDGRLARCDLLGGAVLVEDASWVTLGVEDSDVEAGAGVRGDDDAVVDEVGEITGGAEDYFGDESEPFGGGAGVDGTGVDGTGGCESREEEDREGAHHAGWGVRRVKKGIAGDFEVS